MTDSFTVTSGITRPGMTTDITRQPANKRVNPCPGRLTGKVNLSFTWSMKHRLLSKGCPKKSKIPIARCDAEGPTPASIELMAVLDDGSGMLDSYWPKKAHWRLGPKGNRAGLAWWRSGRRTGTLEMPLARWCLALQGVPIRGAFLPQGTSHYFGPLLWYSPQETEIAGAPLPALMPKIQPGSTVGLAL